MPTRRLVDEGQRKIHRGSGGGGGGGASFCSSSVLGSLNDPCVMKHTPNGADWNYRESYRAFAMIKKRSSECNHEEWCHMRMIVMSLSKV